MEIVISTLALYGASLSHDGHIEKTGRVLRVKPVIKGRRLRFEAGATLLASGPVSAAFVSEFLERFWFWKKI